MQHSSGSGNFPEHSRGHSPLWLSVCPRTNPQNTCHLKPQWRRRTPPPPLAFRSSTFPSGCLRRVWHPQGEMDHFLLNLLSIWAQRQPSPCLTSEIFATVSCSVTLKYLQRRVSLQMSFPSQIKFQNQTLHVLGFKGRVA